MNYFDGISIFVCLAGTGLGKVHEPGLELGTPKAYKNNFVLLLFFFLILLLIYFAFL